MNWISVNDSLPPYNTPVLCWYYPKHPVMDGRIIGILKRQDTSKMAWSVQQRLDKNQFGMASEVTHWIEIPKPPIE